MFGKKKVKSAQIDTLIGKNTVVKGDIHYRGGLHVEGTVKGNLIADTNEKTVLIVSEKGRIEGDVKGPVIIINGSIEGNVHSTSTLEMAQHTKVRGNVYYNLLEMEVGAEINGSLIHQVGVHNTKDKMAQSDKAKDNSDRKVVSSQDEANLTLGS